MTIDDIIKTLPSARRAKVLQRALALMMEKQMTDDLVERLRHRAYSEQPLCNEAAAEIERLTRFLINALDALEAVDSEIVLTGHLKELVDCALAPRQKDAANGR